MHFQHEAWSVTAQVTICLSRKELFKVLAMSAKGRKLPLNEGPIAHLAT